MKAGKVKALFFGSVALVAALLFVQASPVAAQTPDEACAADSLYLISPEEIDLVYDTSGKVGLTVSWPNLDLSQATCYSLADTAGLGYEVTVTGGFGDRVDRVLRFNSDNPGTIGSTGPANMIMDWRHQGPSTYGNLAGKLNLSNNGGLWRFDGAAGTWMQHNSGLPMTWLQNNTLALAKGTGEFLLGGFSRGAALSSPVGLKSYDGTSWTPVAEDVFDFHNPIRALAVSPGDNNTFLVGTESNGLYVTTDGGQNFTQWTTQFDPAFADMPTKFTVEALDWTGGRIYVHLANYGLFTSTDDGQTFIRSELTVPDDLALPPDLRTQIIPVANRIHQDPADPQRALISLQFHGAYETTDGGASWHDLYGDLVVVDPEGIIPWATSATSAVYVDGQPNTIIMGVSQQGVYRSSDNGLTWILVAEDLQPESGLAAIRRLVAINLPGLPGTVLVQEDGHGILQTSDGGASWSMFAAQPGLTKALDILPGESGTGNFYYPTYEGGTYVPGSELQLSDTYTNETSDELQDLEIGLFLSLSAGDHAQYGFFNLICQTYQGWAVWRGPGHRPEEMTLLGLFDNVNPEDCYEGYCGDSSLEIVPNCFAAKRAACFDFSNPDTARFFDEEIYNGFEYTYAVTTFDYGNTALIEPESNSNQMLFSPRFEGDFEENGGLSPYPGPGNAKEIQVNIGTVNPQAGEEIYVYPNPVRLGAGLPRDEGFAVVFTNIPEESRILVFTTAGDKVVELPPEGIQGRNMFWDTHNSSGEELAAGVYLYKVEMTEGEPYWGRLVVIR